LFAQFTVKQEQEIDSINNLIKEARHHTIVAITNIELEEFLYIYNLDTLTYLSDISLAISKKYGDK